MKTLLLLFFILSFSFYTTIFAQGDFTMYSLNNRDYWVYTPTTYFEEIPSPLVVAFHGCSQSATIFAVDSELNDYAEERNFIVVYPDQPTASNSSNCWNWFLEDHQFSESGEPKFNADIIQQVMMDKNIDANRVFALGMSAGAAEAVIMAATYPNLFEAISASAGLEYMGGTTPVEAVGAQVSGFYPNADLQGERAYQEMQKSTPSQIRVIVFHGDMDATVNSNNAEGIIQQWAQTNDLVMDDTDNEDIDALPETVLTETVPGGRTYTHSFYENNNGEVILEKYIIEGMTHRYSGGADNAPGGSIYTDPTGPKATPISLDFFGIFNSSLATAATINFEAVLNINVVELTWNFDHFNTNQVTIQRAVNNQYFSNIGVATLEKAQVSFTDFNLPSVPQVYYRLHWMSDSGDAQYSKIEVVDLTRNKLHLSQNKPNPFTSQTIIDYFLPRKMHVQINLLDAQGQFIKTLVLEEQEAGNQEVVFNSQNLASGAYFYQIHTENGVMSRKMMVMN